MLEFASFRLLMKLVVVCELLCVYFIWQIFIVYVLIDMFIINNGNKNYILLFWYLVSISLGFYFSIPQNNIWSYSREYDQTQHSFRYTCRMDYDNKINIEIRIIIKLLNCYSNEDSRAISHRPSHFIFYI